MLPHVRYLLPAVFFFLLLMPILSATYSSNIGLTANVTVFCPFSITVNASPAYMKYNNITIPYTLQSSANCVTGSMQGTFNLTPEGVELQQLPAINANFSKNSMPGGSISINTATLKNSTYYANVSFTELGKTTTGTAKFTLFNPANMTITSFYATPSTITAGSRPSFFMTIANSGQMTGNIILINISIHGPANASFSMSSNALSQPLIAPQQHENLTISNANITEGSTGNYTAYAKVYYGTAPNSLISSVAVNAISNTASATYSVVPAPAPSPPPTKPAVAPITNTPQFGIVTAPLSTSTIAGSTSISQLGLQNTANASETLYISYPSAYSSFISLSANSIKLSLGQSASIAIAMHPSAGVIPGAYTVPLNVTAKIGNATTTQTEFITINVASSVNAPSISQAITLTNSTTVASGIVKVSAPSTASLSNASLETMIPVALSGNVSQITAYGLPNNISVADGYYIIKWSISSLPAGQVAYAYYTINKPRSQTLLQLVQNVLTVPSPIAPQNKLKVLDIDIPTFYADASNNVTLEMFYTGTSVQQISSMLASPPDIKVSPYESIVNASPNSVVSQRFNVAIGNTTGTAILSLYISTPGFNATYSLPILVLAKPVTTISAATTLPQQGVIPPNMVVPLVVTAILLVFIISVFIVVKSMSGRARYTPNRAAKLIRIREQIKRSDEEE